jgi:hypothetical protein
VKAKKQFYPPRSIIDLTNTYFRDNNPFYSWFNEKYKLVDEMKSYIKIYTNLTKHQKRNY